MYVTDTSYYTNHLDIILNLNDFELHSPFGGKCSEKHLTFMKRLPIPETCDVSCRIVLRPDRETIRSSGHALNETSTPKKLHYLVETKISKWESTHEMFAVVIATAWCPSRSGIITMATGPHHVMSLEGYSGFSR